MEYYKKECLYCGKEYLVEKARIEKAKCCSKECFNKFRKDNPDYSGDNNYNWKGKIKRSGYWYIKDLKHPNGGKQNYIAEHRIVMEKKLGRYLDKKEIVHHKDGDKENNNVDNLELCESRGKHSRDQHARNYSEMAYKYWETQPKNCRI